MHLKTINATIIPTLHVRSIIRSSLVVLIASIIAWIVNALYNQYPGNNYFPPHTFFIGGSLLLIYAGMLLQYGKKSQLAVIMQETIFFFMVMALLIIATNAVQYTPFMPIDRKIIRYSAWLPIDLLDLMNWTYAHPRIQTYLEWIYRSLTHQMTYLPLLVIVFRRIVIVREYYFLLLVTTLLGYVFYYFFPTTAPASILDNPHFNVFQHATGLKFNQIHQHIQPTTLKGGMVSLPSFHVIWAWLCVHLLRPWPRIFWSMLLINLSLVASCVLLGWHYPIDVLGSVVVILIGHGLYAYCLSSALRTAANRQPAKTMRSSTTRMAMRW